MHTLDNVAKVYTGKIGCMCGCLGNWRYTQDGATNHGPGYDVQDAVNERSVKIVFNKIMKDPTKIVEGDCVYVEHNGRIKAVYFK